MKILVKSDTAFYYDSKSEFRSKLHVIQSREEASAIVKELKKLHPDAAHVVWAYITGTNREIFGASDDGEPSGTSGKPMLEVIKGSGATNILVTSVRFFGGIKLGTGGLVKAYTQSAKLAVANAVFKEMVESLRFKINIPYTMFDQVKQQLIQMDYSSEIEDFLENVFIAGIINRIYAEDFSKFLLNLSKGQIKPEYSLPFYF